MLKPQTLRKPADRHGSSLLQFKYSVLTPLGDPAAMSGKVLGLASTIANVDALLGLAPGLSYDRIRREIVRDGVSTSVVTVTDYAGYKGPRKLVVIIARLDA
jgi:hypothetical protein